MTVILRSLSFALYLGAEEYALYSSFITLVCALFTQAAKLETMLENPRKGGKGRNYELKDFYKAKLKILEANIKYLYQYSRCLQQAEPQYPKTTDDMLQGNSKKINNMIVKAENMWLQVDTSKRARHCGINTPQLPEFIVKRAEESTSQKVLFELISEQYKALDQSFEIELMRLYILTRELESLFNRNMTHYHKITQCIHTLKEKIDPQNTITAPQIK